MQSTSEIIYRLNERDEICYVNPQYDVFAKANAGTHIESREILHRSLWDFLSDSTTQQLYRDALLRARAGRRVQFRFRCDSPTHRRLMEMEIASDAAGNVEFRVRTIALESRAAQALLDPNVPRTQDVLRMCGWCKKVYADGEWVEVEEAVNRLRLFEQPALPLLTHGICEQCYQTAMTSLENHTE